MLPARYQRIYLDLSGLRSANGAIRCALPESQEAAHQAPIKQPGDQVEGAGDDVQHCLPANGYPTIAGASVNRSAFAFASASACRLAS